MSTTTALVLEEDTLRGTYITERDLDMPQKWEREDLGKKLDVQAIWYLVRLSEVLPGTTPLNFSGQMKQ